MRQCGDQCAVSVRRCGGIRDVRVMSDAGADAVISPIRAAWWRRATTLLKMCLSLLALAQGIVGGVLGMGNAATHAPLLTQRARALTLAEAHVCAPLSMPPSSCVR